MFDDFIKEVERVTDTADKLSYRGVLLGTALALTSLIMTTLRRINKFVDKVLNKDEG